MIARLRSAFAGDPLSQGSRGLTYRGLPMLTTAVLSPDNRPNGFPLFSFAERSHTGRADSATAGFSRWPLLRALHYAAAHARSTARLFIANLYRFGNPLLPSRFHRGWQ